MTDIMLTIRLPRATRARLRALGAVTGMSAQELIVAAFANYYDRLPPVLKEEVAPNRRCAAAPQRDLIVRLKV